MTKLKQKPRILETVNFDGRTINLGIDVHKKNWSVAVYLDQTYVQTFHQPSSGEALLGYLKGHFPGATYRACYEAGFCGFSVQRELTALNIHCFVVNAADVPQTHKGMLSKTDASDARRLGEAFAKDLLRPIYIPDSGIEGDRNFIRYRKKAGAVEGKKARRESMSAYTGHEDTAAI